MIFKSSPFSGVEIGAFGTNDVANLRLSHERTIRVEQRRQASREAKNYKLKMKMKHWIENIRIYRGWLGGWNFKSM